MDVCLLCEAVLNDIPSWQKLFAKGTQQVICESCSTLFERADIRSKTENLTIITSLYTYNEAMKDYLHQYKFLRDVALADVFAAQLREALLKKKHIVPIPMHPNRQKERTFAHVEMLLRSAKLSYENVLLRNDETVMGEKTRQQRLQTAPLFSLSPSAQLQNETYTLIDDIYTTGTTLQHAAQILLAAGVKEVEAITLIRA